jgi:hypothetical protein
MRINLAVILTALTALAGAASCAIDDDGTSSSGASGGAEDAGADAAQSLTLRIEPSEASAEVTLDTAPPAVDFKAFAKRDGDAAETDVTGEVAWSSGSEAMASVGSDGSAKLKGIGGKTEIRATLEGASAAAALTVKLRGDVFLPGTDAAAKADFDAAAPDAEPSNAPAIEYPEDGVVLPANLPPIEAQWTQAADNNLYRVRVVLPDILDVALFTAARELAFPKDVWAKISASAPDKEMSLVIEGMGPGKMKRASAPRAMTVTSDVIDASAIYVWQSSSGSFRVIDIINQTDVPLPNDSFALQAGQNCSGCHRISRDGKRFAYSFDGSNFRIGTLAYDEAQKIYTSKIAPAAGVRGTYATFNPLEDVTEPAMLLTVPDEVPQNTPGTTRLEMRDPDTNALLPSNIAETIASIDPVVGRATMMPDWSPAGDFVVFAAYNNEKNYVRLLGDDIVLASIVEASVKYEPATGAFTFGPPKVLVAAPDAAAENPDTGQNNFLPSISPDGQAVAFTRAAGWWSIKTQQSLINLSGQLMIVRRSDGTVFELVKGSNGPGTTMSSTWPQWAPTLGSRYAWLAYASERPYGHRLTPAISQCSLVQGQKQCKQLWITAIDREKLGSGTEDPSRAPFWIPGQSVTAQYVSPQWTKAVLPPPK